jgi:hypothetical protein
MDFAPGSMLEGRVVGVVRGGSDSRFVRRLTTAFNPEFTEGPGGFGENPASLSMIGTFRFGRRVAGADHLG